MACSYWPNDKDSHIGTCTEPDHYQPVVVAVYILLIARRNLVLCRRSRSSKSEVVYIVYTHRDISLHSRSTLSNAMPSTRLAAC